MRLKFMTEPTLNPALMVCPHCGEDEKIWIHCSRKKYVKANWKVNRYKRMTAILNLN